MNQQEIYTFVETYLRSLDCSILVKDPTYITAQLTPEVDKHIMNRPFYWMFVERTGAKPQPAQLTFVFDNDHVPEHIRGELLKFGCWRLHQIFESAKQNGQFIRLYEEVSQSNLTQGLIPWLLINYKISFISDQKKDIFYPLGFNLVSGEILTDFELVLDQYQLTQKIPDYHFTFRPIYSLPAAIGYIEQHVHQFLQEQDTSWANEANKRLDEEITIIKSFFSEKENALAELKMNRHTQQGTSQAVEDDSGHHILSKRLAEVEQYRPRIEVDPINVGVVYLQTHPQAKIRLK